MNDINAPQNPMITAASLSQYAPQVGDAAAHAAALEEARLNSTVNTPQRLCHFMGQIYVESAGFTRMEENLDYRNPARLASLFRAVKGTADAAAVAQDLRPSPTGSMRTAWAMATRLVVTDGAIAARVTYSSRVVTITRDSATR